MEAEKNLQLETWSFYRLAVVAIAITLLALELKNRTRERICTYTNVASNQTKFSAFFLHFLTSQSFGKFITSFSDT
ncbi:MAG: hypothetical protein QM734_07845 [Cyclobacteriaceae bacterium]